MPAIDINQFFDQSQQNYFFNKRFGYWNAERGNTSKKKGVSTESLVKVIHNGRVTWFTADEAQRLLADLDDENAKEASFKANLEKALRGSSRTLAEEIRVLFNLAIQTLFERVREGIVEDEQAEEYTTNLRRRFEEAEGSIEDLMDLETELTQRKRAEPIFASYENKLAEMMRLQKAGDFAQAAVLAKQLMHEKKHYLLRSRALEPLTYAAYYYRLDLQKIKGRVLDTQRQLCEMRDSLVKNELQKIRDNLGAQTDDLFEEPDDLPELPSPEEGQAIRRYQQELRNLALESRALVRTIEEAENICRWIENEIFKDENLKQAAVTHAQTRKQSRSDEGSKGQAPLKHGMVVMDRIKKKKRK